MSYGTIGLIVLVTIGLTCLVADLKHKDVGKWAALALAFGVFALLVLLVLPSDPPKAAGIRPAPADSLDRTLVDEGRRAAQLQEQCDALIVDIEATFPVALPTNAEHPGLKVAYLESCERSRRGGEHLDHARALRYADPPSALQAARDAVRELEAARMGLRVVTRTLFPDRVLL